MKVLAILGSRDPNGKTSRCVDALLKGLNSDKDQAQKVFLTEKKIERCRQCNVGGWGICSSEGRCIIEDDFAAIADQIHHSDAAVFASPVYYGDISESMRAFLDRFRRCGRSADFKKLHENKPAIAISSAGGGNGAAACLGTLEKVLNQCGFFLADIVGVRRQNLTMKQAVLETLGRWVSAGLPLDA